MSRNVVTSAELCMDEFRWIVLKGRIRSGGATPERARSNDLAGRSTYALAPALPIASLCFGNSVKRK